MRKVIHAHFGARNLDQPPHGRKDQVMAFLSDLVTSLVDVLQGPSHEVAALWLLFESHPRSAASKGKENTCQRPVRRSLLAACVGLVEGKPKGNRSPKPEARSPSFRAIPPRRNKSTFSQANGLGSTKSRVPR